MNVELEHVEARYLQVGDQIRWAYGYYTIVSVKHNRGQVVIKTNDPTFFVMISQEYQVRRVV